MKSLSDRCDIELHNADCMELLKTYKDNQFDYTFTSPPYNRKRNDKYDNYNDSLDDYYLFLTTVINELLRVSKYVFFNIQKNYYNKQDVFKLIGDYSKEIIDVIIWNKSNPMPASGLNLTNAYEFIFIISNSEKSIKANETYTKNSLTTLVYSNNPYKKIHRAVMNPQVVQWFVKNFTKNSDSVLDCFMGCGTTGIICKENGINFTGIELDEDYFKSATERIERHTSQMQLF